MLPEGEELSLGMVVVDKEADMGRGGASHRLKSVDSSTDGSGDLVGAKVEAAVDCDAILEDEEGGCFVNGVGDGVYHDVGGV